jgi:hypothetical protein
MCDKLSFAECEMTILRTAVDAIEKREGHKLVHTPSMARVIQMVEQFIREKKCIIYGGTAINNILPVKDQFYDYEYELPDYDFFTPEPMLLATELADIFAEQGYQVEAKSGVHHGTYKVFVEQIGVADITFIHQELYKKLLKSVIIKKGLMYAPANFLRQSMYSELSRPLGNVSRWEKILKRLNALNKNYPLKRRQCKLQRRMSSRRYEFKLFILIKRFFISKNVVFIGGYANALYTNYTRVPRLENLPDFDVLSDDPKETANLLVRTLIEAGYNATVQEHEGIDELISTHYSVSVDEDYVAFLYKPIACHSYNEIKEGNRTIKVGTIDTLLSYYLAFMYADRDYYDENRLVCLSSVLFKVQQENRLAQTGLLKRFGIQCYGNQPTLKTIREENNRLFATLNPRSKEFKERFFKYVPKTRKKKLKQYL